MTIRNRIHSPTDHIRIAQPSDLARCRAIERDSFTSAWTARDWDCVWGHPYYPCWVATAGPVPQYGDGYVIGYAMCEVRPKSHELVSIAVAVHARGRGFGRALVEQVLELGQQCGRPTRCLVPERSLAAQLFFRACGLLAVGIERGAFGEEDGWWMEVGP